MAESKGDPVVIGDQHLVDHKWSPSIGLFQIRSLKHPGQFSPPDTLRIAAKLKDPLYNAQDGQGHQTRAQLEPMVHVHERGLQAVHGWRARQSRQLRAVPWCVVLPHR
ncbi:hypothetical protein [Streptomyces europaeiscabiei]|uniref:hypothetical protein n=1 Tax=Streptomyces europaeiscabiei TaxID=146819 RepID=UPI002E281ACE|nr:hypothetical protein [Streptomyces europaeiscabiei]